MKADGKELWFNGQGKPELRISYYRNPRDNASGLIIPSGSLPIRVATSGWHSLKEQLRHYQLDNDRGADIIDWCTRMGYHIASSSYRGNEDVGNFLAVHVEKKLLHDYCIRNECRFGHHYRHFHEIDGEEVSLYIDRPPCFDCILFCHYFAMRTNTRIKVFHNGIDYMRHTELLGCLALLLILGKASLCADLFASEQRAYTGEDLKSNSADEPMFLRSAESYDEWCRQFVRG